MKLSDEFMSEMRNQLPEGEVNELIHAINSEPIVSIRLNDKVVDSNILIEKRSCIELKDPVPWSKRGYYLHNRPSFTLDPLFHAGLYYVQEASSMFLEQAVKTIDCKTPIKVLDLCAAPGGKSTHLCSLLPEGSLLVSNEILRGRANILVENLSKWGKPGVMVTNNSPEQIGDSGLQFDVILVDAPCSGEGMFRKDSTAVSEWSIKNVEMCASRQRDILTSIWPALKPGGYLIYSTCTYNRSEDEDNVNWIVSEFNAEFKPIDISDSWNVTPSYHFFPHKSRGEGFFLSLLRKPESSFSGDYIGTPSKSKFPVPSECINWINHPDDFFFESDGNHVVAMPMNMAACMQDISECLNVLMRGVDIADIKGHDVIPAHGLAMNRILNRNAFFSVELDREQALKYLHAEAIQLTDAPKGIVLLKFADVTLGFAKNIGNRANNLYPKEWRIRMNL